MATFVPRLLYSAAGELDDVAYMEHLHGESIDNGRLTSAQAEAAGRRLATIHTAHGGWYGSLDGRFRFDSWARSWVPRWELMTRLVARVDRPLSVQLLEWGLDRLPSVEDSTPPTLVHGDFGPSNLIWPSADQDPWVIDWEHARYGHPAEDIVKLHLAEIFPEPNGFRGRRGSLLIHVEASRQETLPQPPWSQELERLLLVYFAGTLGVFLDPPWRPRLAWLKGLLA